MKPHWSSTIAELVRYFLRTGPTPQSRSLSRGVGNPSSSAELPTKQTKSLQRSPGLLFLVTSTAFPFPNSAERDSACAIALPSFDQSTSHH